MRWSKGFYQVDAKYTSSLLSTAVRGGKKGFSCYDMLMTVAPSNLITVCVMFIALIVCLSGFSMPTYVTLRVLRMIGHILWTTVWGIVCSLFLFGAITMAAEWKKIDGPARRKLLYVFTFPFFMLTYVPISLAALCGKVEWKPIRHGVAMQSKEE